MRSADRRTRAIGGVDGLPDSSELPAFCHEVERWGIDSLLMAVRATRLAIARGDCLWRLPGRPDLEEVRSSTEHVRPLLTVARA